MLVICRRIAQLVRVQNRLVQFYSFTSSFQLPDFSCTCPERTIEFASPIVLTKSLWRHSITTMGSYDQIHISMSLRINLITHSMAFNSSTVLSRGRNKSETKDETEKWSDPPYLWCYLSTSINSRISARCADTFLCADQNTFQCKCYCTSPLVTETDKQTNSNKWMTNERTDVRDHVLNLSTTTTSPTTARKRKKQIPCCSAKQ